MNQFTGKVAKNAEKLGRNRRCGDMLCRSKMRPFKTVGSCCEFELHLDAARSF